MKWWADWLVDNPRDHAKCPRLTNFEVFKDREHNLSYGLAGVGACQLRKRDRQVVKVSLAVDAVDNDTLGPALAAVCCPPVKANFNVTL